MDPSQDFKSWQEKLQNGLIKTTKTVNRIASEDLSFQRTVNPAVGDQLDDRTSRLFQLSTSLLRAAAATSDQRAPKLEDADDVDINWRGVVDVIDSLLEKADTSLDEYTGLVKRKDAPTSETGPTPKKTKPTDRLNRSLQRANIIKPQTSFEHRPDNFDEGPWKPLLTQKPHAIIPLESSLFHFLDEDGTKQYDILSYLPLMAPSPEKFKQEDLSLGKIMSMATRRKRIEALGSVQGTNGKAFRFKHPYQTEILQLKYPDAVYQIRDPIPFLPVETTSAIWVDTFEGVLVMLDELKQAPEIAVDLEHHDFRSYNGLLSLMQISTRQKDWVVDTLQPWRHRLEILNEVFADPTKVKVFHGAFMDIIWLQRDLGLYVVGLFDTFHGCEALGYEKRSLAGLLKKFVDFDADKKYQLADWRIRPLPKEMLYYARSDTHYLLYIFDNMRNELVKGSDKTDPDKNLIEWSLQSSKETSLSRYETFSYDFETGRGPRGWFNTLSRLPFMLNGEQFAVYKAVHQWRDKIARKEDESPHFIMPNAALLDIAKAIPSEHGWLKPMLYNCAHTTKMAANDLLALIHEAKLRGEQGPSTTAFFRADTARVNAQAEAPETYRANGDGREALDKNMPNIDELQTSQSQLWGGVPVSSLWENTTSKGGRHSERSAVHMSLPAVTLTPTAAGKSLQNVTPNNLQSQKTNKDGQASSSIGAADLPMQEFTLRAGRQDKVPEVQEEVGSEIASSGDDENDLSVDAGKQSGEISEQESQEATKSNNHDKRKQRKIRKRDKIRRERKEADQVTGKKGNGSAKRRSQSMDEDAPFDYSKAKSVLHGQRGHDQGTDGSKIINPYVAKATADGPKAARRLHGEKIGKTATFKK